MEVKRPPFPLNDHPDYSVVKFSESFVFEVIEATVVGHGYVITNNDQVIEETSRAWKNFKDHPLFQEGATPEIATTNKTVAVISSNAPACFTHWMLDILPRLKLLEDSGAKFDLLYVPRFIYPFQIETLRFLGIPDNILIQGSPQSALSAKKLIVPSLIQGVSTVRSPWTYEYLQSKFLGSNTRKKTKSRRLYISRKISTTPGYRRYIVNEKEVMTFLAPLGFENVTLEDFSVVEQAEMFANAEVIVATHGAALTHLVFCKVGTAVVEIFLPHHLCEGYYSIGIQMNLRYHCLLSNHDRLTPDEKELGDVYIPIDELERSFKKLEIIQ